MLKINEKNYEFINNVYNLISPERLHNLKKDGNTIIGPYKINYIKKRLDELGLDEVFDVSTGFDYIWSETSEQEILDEIAHIISYITGIEVKVLKAIYPSDILVPGELDYTYLIIDASKDYLIKRTLSENDMIEITNERNRKIPKSRRKADITHFF